MGLLEGSWVAICRVCKFIKVHIYLPMSLQVGFCCRPFRSWWALLLNDERRAIGQPSSSPASGAQAGLRGFRV